MGRFFKKLKGEPIIVYTAGPDADVNFAAELAQEMTELLDQQPGKVFYIANMLPVVQLDFDGLSRLVAAASWGEGSPFQHRNIEAVITVTTNPALATATRNLGTQIYGNVPSYVVDNIEDALNIARS